MARTSDRVSSIAANLARITPQAIEDVVARKHPDGISLEKLAADIRSMAASLLRQDEHRGLRGLVKKVLGK